VHYARFIYLARASIIRSSHHLHLIANT